MKKHKQYGFTIVELLIVIVVIGILAAITIVAYNGIQTRAKNTQLFSAMDTYEKALRQYKVFNGSYPNTVGGYACLGGPFSEKAPFGADECYIYGGSVVARRQQAVENALATIIQPLPKTADNTTALGSGATTGAARGILYYSFDNGNQAWLIYAIKDDQDCARGTKTYDNTPGSTPATSCRIDLD